MSSRYVAGEIFAVPLHDERWGTLQVSHCDASGGAELVALAMISDDLPTLDDVAGCKPLVLSHHAHRGQFCRARVGESLHPWDFVSLGRIALLANFEERSTSWADWDYARYQILAQWRWDNEVPDDIRGAYGNARLSREQIALVVGGAEQRLVASTTQLALLPSPPSGAANWQLSAPGGELIDWAELAQLLLLTDLTYVGGDVGVVELASSLPLLDRLVWSEHGQHEIDLSGTRLRNISLDAGKALELTLPACVESLIIRASAHTEIVTIHDPFEGRRLQLVLHDPLPPTIAGPAQLRRMRASGLRQAPCDRFARCPELRELELLGAPGELVNAPALAELPELRRLALHDFYRIDGELPPFSQWPALDAFSFDGIKRSDAESLGERMRGARRLEIHGVKSDSWIAGNVNNPFRDWVDADTRLGKAACAAYRKALAALGKLARDDVDGGKHVVELFVDALNRLDATHGLDTTQRETAAHALHALLERVPWLDATVAAAWFDARRDF